MLCFGRVAGGCLRSYDMRSRSGVRLEIEEIGALGFCLVCFYGPVLLQCVAVPVVC